MRGAVSGRTKVFALLGHPVAHSLSPAIYNPLFVEHGLDAVYVVHDLDPTAADDLMAALAVLPFAGVNLTVPFKAAPVVSPDQVVRVDAVGRAIGAVNTLVRVPGDGRARYTGHNTDAMGFVHGLMADEGEVVRGAHAVVLGAGGAGRAVAAGLALGGAAQITVLNRTPARAQAACAAVGTLPGVQATVLRAGGLSELPDALRTATLVVQAMSGPGADALPVSGIEQLGSHSVWADLNYWQAPTPAWRAAQAAGCRMHDGLPMLAYQGAAAFRLFTGLPAEGRAVLARLREAQAAGTG